MAVSVIEPHTSRIVRNFDELGWSPGERRFSPFDVNTAHIGSRDANSLRSDAGKFSAVENQPSSYGNVKDIFNHVKNSKKSLLPYLLGGGTAGATALASPEDAEAASIGPHGSINLFGTPPIGERRAAPSLLDSLTQAYLPDQTPRAGYGEEGGRTLISRFQGHTAQPSTQLMPLSAVTPQPVKSLGKQPEAVKKSAQSAFLMNQVKKSKKAPQQVGKPFF